MGGELRETEGYVEVEAADEVLAVVALYAGGSHRETPEGLRELIERLPADYDELLEPHVPIHRELFERTAITLADAASEETVDELLLRSYDGDVPTALVTLMHDFGRYLSICSSRPGGWPANLQGVWNGDYRPAWSADYHNDENIQMNYWAALPGMLPEIALPMFDYYERYLDDYRENARRLYGCRGILVPIAQSLHGGM